MSRQSVREGSTDDPGGAAAGGVGLRPGGVLANFSWLTLGALVSRAAQFLLTVYLTRVLETGGFGRLAYVQAFLWYGLILVDFGLSVIATRETARDPRSVASLAGNIWCVRLGIFLIEFSLLAAVLWAMPVDAELRWLFVFSFLSLFAHAVRTDWIFRGFEKMQYVAVWEALPGLVWLAGALLVVHERQDLLKVPLLRFAAEILACGLLLAAAIWKLRFTRQALAACSYKKMIGLLREAAPVGVAALLVQVYYGVDVILLRLMKGFDVAGQYAAAYRVVTLLLTGMFLLGATYQPVLARCFAADLQAFRRQMQRLLGVSLILGTVFPAAVAVGSAPIVRLLFGGAYAAAAAPLAILMAAMPLAYLAGGYGAALIAAGLQRKMMSASGAAAVSNVVLNLALIPPFGMAGAALATVISYAVVYGLQWWFFSRKVFGTSPLPVGAAVETVRQAATLFLRRGTKL